MSNPHRNVQPADISMFPSLFLFSPKCLLYNGQPLIDKQNFNEELKTYRTDSKKIRHFLYFNEKKISKITSINSLRLFNCQFSTFSICSCSFFTRLQKEVTSFLRFSSWIPVTSFRMISSLGNSITLLSLSSSCWKKLRIKKNLKFKFLNNGNKIK